MIVVGAGYGRTGTSSLRDALEKLLGGKCYHMRDVFQHPEHVQFWERTMTKHGGAKGVSDSEWKEFFGDYVACCDLPVSTFYEHLARIYPEAKIILTTRDADSWYRSCMDTIAPEFDTPFPKNLLFWLSGMSNFAGMCTDLTIQDFGTCDWSDAELMKKQFVARNERVKATIPADRLLVFEAKEGWEPLCKFLNLPIPDEPYPRVNDTKEFNSRKGPFQILSYLIVYGVPALLASVLGVYYAYNYY